MEKALFKNIKTEIVIHTEEERLTDLINDFLRENKDYFLIDIKFSSVVFIGYNKENVISYSALIIFEIR